MITLKTAPWARFHTRDGAFQADANGDISGVAPGSIAYRDLILSGCIPEPAKAPAAPALEPELAIDAKRRGKPFEPGNVHRFKPKGAAS